MTTLLPADFTDDETTAIEARISHADTDAARLLADTTGAVSYTHLTLPMIYSV